LNTLSYVELNSAGRCCPEHVIKQNNNSGTRKKTVGTKRSWCYKWIWRERERDHSPL